MIEVVCLVCQEPVVGKRKDAKYCSERCGSKARNRKYRKDSRDKFLATQKRSNEKFRSTPYGKIHRPQTQSKAEWC